jgi:hypothetical protein
LKRKIALLAVTFAILMLVEVQAAETAKANPFGWTFPEVPTPSITISSPTENQSYPLDDVWLKFTVIKPSSWVSFKGRIWSVTYSVNDTAEGFKKETIDVQDPGTVDSPSTFNFSVKLPQMVEGRHLIEIEVGGIYDGTQFNVMTQQAFTVYRDSSQTTVTLVSLSIAVIVGVSIIVFFKYKKKKSD